MTNIRIAFAKNENEVEKTYGPITGDIDVLSLFTESFMKEYTKYNSIFDFIEAAGLTNQKDDWNKLQDGKIDSFIKSNSSFESWADMKETAIACYESTQG